MADDTRILNGFYKDIPIAIASGSVDGGRKTVTKQFPGRDTQSVEDMGLMPRKYALEIILKDDYFDYRNKLLAALEQKGGGVLIHPLYGRIENVIAISYSLNENFSSFGGSTVSVNFEISNNTGIPQSAKNSASELDDLVSDLKSKVAKDIEENFSITESYVDNFFSAIDKVNGFIDQAKEATSFIGETADTINEFTNELGDLAANVNSLVTAPLALGQAVTGLFDTVNGLYASSEATFETFLGFFGFGNTDISIKTNTASRVERKKNNDVFNGAVAASALGYAYLSAVQIDFKTTRDIDTLAALLDDQFDSVLTSAASQDVIDAIIDIRVVALAALEEARVKASQIISVQTNPTSARLLAFAYYGNDSEGETLTDLNSFTDVSFIEGSAEIITA